MQLKGDSNDDVKMTVREEAINSYLVWEFSKPIVRTLLDAPETPVQKIIDWTHHICCAIQESQLSLEEKLQVVARFSPQSARATLFKRCSWTRRDYPISRLGTVLPEVGDLPPEVIVKPLREAVNFVRNLTSANLRSPIYIRKLAMISPVLQLFPVIIIEPATLQRSETKMSDFYHKRDWNLFIGNGYIEDGNHRALALCLSNDALDDIPSYVGWFA